MAFFPNFYGQFPEIYRTIKALCAVSMSPDPIHPPTKVKDGKFRKIKVELVDPNTNQPLRVNDQKGKPIKYQIVAKSGYTAPHAVE